MLILRRMAFFIGLAALAGCGANDLEEPPVPLGNFALGLNIVVADNVQKVPISRDASVEEWEAVMKDAVAKRFGRYEGTKLYNIGISVDGYALAPPGIPVVAAPKSVPHATTLPPLEPTKYNPIAPAICLARSTPPPYPPLPPPSAPPPPPTSPSTSPAAPALTM